MRIDTPAGFDHKLTNQHIHGRRGVVRVDKARDFGQIAAADKLAD
jgi:hypothetical protein